MRVWTLVCAVAALLLAASPDVPMVEAKVIPPSDPTQPFEAWIDLSLPPEERWAELVTAVIETHGFTHSYGPVLDFIDYGLPFGKVIVDTLEQKLQSLGAAVLRSDVFREIKGIHAVMSKYSKRMTLGRLVLLNLFYDVTAGCTSVAASSTAPDYCSDDAASLAGGGGAPVVCANATNPVPIHGRNLDFPIPGLNNLTSVAHFFRSGPSNGRRGQGTGEERVLARGVVYAAYVGVLTGYRPGGWSVSVNQRNRHAWTHESFYILQNLYAFLKGAESLGVFLREALLTVPDYGDAVALLSNQTLPAPVYLTVAGVAPSDGAVLTRNRFGLDRSRGDANAAWAMHAPVNGSAPGAGDWFRAETNDDHWDAARDKRRGIINQSMARMTPAGATVGAMREALYKPGTFNDWTTFVSVMSPAFDVLLVEVAPKQAGAALEALGPNMDALGELYHLAYNKPEEYLRRLTFREEGDD